MVFYIALKYVFYGENNKKMRKFSDLSWKSKNYSYLCTAEPLERVGKQKPRWRNR